MSQSSPSAWYGVPFSDTCNWLTVMAPRLLTGMYHSVPELFTFTSHCWVIQAEPSCCTSTRMSTSRMQSTLCAAAPNPRTAAAKKAKKRLIG